MPIVPPLRLMLISGACAVTLALPAFAAIPSAPPPYGDIVMPVEEHFSLVDADNSGDLTPAEYAAVSLQLKGQAISDARADFAAMDMNGDGIVTLDEFYGEMPSALTL